MHAQHVVLIEQFYDELWNRFNKTLIPAILSDDVRFRGSLGQEMRGHAEVANYADFVRDAFPDFHNTIKELFGEDDRAAARLTYRGTHRGELFGISAAGRKIEYAGTAFFRFRDNRIREIWVLGDVHGLIQRLSSATGLEPSEPLRQPSAASLLETVSLRPTTPDDLNFVLEAERDPDSAPYIIPWARSQHSRALSDPDLAHLIIERLIDRQRVGFVLLAGLTNPHQNMEFRRIVVTAKGKGYGRAAVRAVKHFAIREHNAHRLWLDVKQHNTRARQLYESEAFVFEGVLRECLKTETGFDSLVVMSTLATETPL